MKSRWTDAGASEAIARWGAEGETLALRVYSSRLIGSERELVLHGGGNTSAKGEIETLLGERVPCLWVKGSGSSLDVVEPRDHPAVDLAYLRRLSALARMTDEEMVNQLRTHLFDARAPNPSVEALLHAFLPHRFVDHSHADAVVALTNQPDGGARARDALGDRVGVLPFIMPGFPLAKAVAALYAERPDVVGIVLEKHGLFTFGDSARESYERHIELVDACERYLSVHARRATASAPQFDASVIHARVARAAPILRGLLAERTGAPDTPFRRFVAEHRASDDVLAFCASSDAARLAIAGPLTPDHVIRTKANALFLAAPSWDDEARLREELSLAVDSYRREYDATFARCAAEKGVSPKKLDSAPRVLLLGGAGALSFGRTKRDARVAADIAEHTVRAKLRSDALGRYEGLPASDLFDMEYWSLEQAKLGAAVARPLEGQIALVTGGAGAIGRGIAEACAAAGAHVVIVDRDASAADAAAATIEKRFGPGSAIAIAADVTDEDAMRRAFDRACVAYGGVDLVVPNAGVALVEPIESLSAAEARRVCDVNYIGVLNTIREAARVFRAQATGGNIVVNASKNVFAPGKDFAAYSASKAAAHQLGKVAAIELAPLGVRVNQLNADAVFAHDGTSSGLWDAVGPSRAKSRGMSVDALPDFYRDRNLLHARVEARHLGAAVVFFASGAVVTTGATLPIDGGVAEAFPR